MHAHKHLHPCRGDGGDGDLQSVRLCRDERFSYEPTGTAVPRRAVPFTGKTSHGYDHYREQHHEMTYKYMSRDLENHS